MAKRIQLRRDTAANWTAANPVLAQGELGIETDSGKLKIGNGTDQWSALDYFGGEGVPPGTIVLWSGAIANIPDGWALCDGTNGTPDLRNRFIVGAGQTYSVGATGGSTSHDHGTSMAEEFVSTGPAISVISPSADHLPPYYALAYIMRL